MTPTFFDSGQLGLVDADPGHGGVGPPGRGREGSALAPRVRAEPRRRRPRPALQSCQRMETVRPAVRRGRGDRKRRGGAGLPLTAPLHPGSGLLSPSLSPAVPRRELSGAGSLRARLFIVNVTFFLRVGEGLETPYYRRSGFSNRSGSSGPPALSRAGSGCLCPCSPFPSHPTPALACVPPAREMKTCPGRASNE